MGEERGVGGVDEAGHRFPGLHTIEMARAAGLGEALELRQVPARGGPQQRLDRDLPRPSQPE